MKLLHIYNVILQLDYWLLDGRKIAIEIIKYR
jgi:hypothetical protein